MGHLRKQGLENISKLAPAERQTLMKALEAMPPEQAGKMLAQIGRYEDPKALMDFIRHREPAPEGVSPVEAFVREEAPLLEEEAGHVKIKQTVTVRVSPDKVQGPRGDLRKNMIANPPKWAEGNPKAWEAHHVIPVEEQFHSVFNTLRETKQGWNDNAPENGIALPTTPEGAKKSGLPMHQATREGAGGQPEGAGAAPQRSPAACSATCRATPTSTVTSGRSSMRSWSTRAIPSSCVGR